MSTQSNAIPESFESQRTAPAILSPTRPFYWSVRRELWEYPSIYIAPLVVAAVALLGFVVATIGRGMATSDLARRQAVLEEPPIFAVGAIMVTALIVAIFYCLEALHSERRDRSILFWKSLPVSDLTTVLAKASIPLVVLQALTIVISVALQFIMLLLSSAVLAASGLSVAPLWTRSFQFSLMLTYHLVTIHALWYAPVYCYLLLVSAWARRMPFLWAALPLLIIGVLEKMVFRSLHFAHFIGYRFGGGVPGGSFSMEMKTMNPLSMLEPAQFLLTPGLWLGLLVAAAFLAAAVRLRRNHGPI